MAAMPAINRPTHPGAICGTLQACINGGGPTSHPQGPGLHSTSQDLGPPSYLQHPMSARPVFYVHGPPPPHFLHYQWPMPFSYNPFAGFPGMGYGMVMPPFHPPPPYMEAPAYVVPNTNMQPVDYRRFVHAPSAPYQNPNQAHRVRLPYMGNVRETVNSEVQTEPTRRGAGSYREESPVVSLDSGCGTASNSPLSSTSDKQGPAEVDNYTLSSSDQNDNQVKGTSANGTVKHCFDILQPKVTKTVQAHIKAPLEKKLSHKDVVELEMVSPCRASCSKAWSRSSADGMDPLCRSSQKEKVVLERRDSVPDILISWGETQTTMLSVAKKVPLHGLSTEVDHVESVYQSPIETRKSPAVAGGAFAEDAEGNLSSADSMTLFKILKMREVHEARKAEYGKDNGDWWGMVGPVKPCPLNEDEELQSASDSIGQDYGNWTNIHEETADIVPSNQISLNSGQIKGKMNESVWSVESLAPYIPTKEWFLQNCTFEHQAIVEMTEETENGVPSIQNNSIVEAGDKNQTLGYSPSNTDLMSDSWLAFSTPAGKRSLPKKPETKRKIALEIKRPKQGHYTDPSDKDSSPSQTCLPPSKVELSTATDEDVDKIGSSEPEANQSPNQQSLFVNEQQEQSPSSQEQEGTLLFKSAAGEKISFVGQIILNKGLTNVTEDGASGNNVGQHCNERLCVPIANQKIAQVSPSKSHLVDCGVQCHLQLQDCNCKKAENDVGAGRRDHLKSTDKKALNGQAEGFDKVQYRKNRRKIHGGTEGQKSRAANRRPTTNTIVNR
ncbi:uncharacterized protein AB9W97_021864 [Spinachia spinachia]